MIGLLGPDDHRTRRTPGRLIAAQRSETVGGAQLEGGSAAGPSAAAPARRPARAVRWLRRRPTVAAALIYAVLSLVMVGQGLLPGWTLSSSDVLYSDVPVEGGPPRRRPGARRELRAGRRGGRVPALLAVRPRRGCRTSRSGTRTSRPGGRSWPTRSPRSSPRSAGPRTCCRSGSRSALDGGAEAVRRRLRRRSCSGARSACASAARCWPALVFAFGTFFVVWLAWPLTNIFPLLPWLLAAQRAAGATPAPLPAAGLARAGRPRVPRRPPGDDVPRARSRRSSSSPSGCCCAARDRRAGRARARARRRSTFALALVAGTAIAAVMLVPLPRAAAALGRPRPPAERAVGLLAARSTSARSSCTTTGGARPRRRDIDPFMQIRGWYAGGLTLMLAAAALILRPTATRVARRGVRGSSARRWSSAPGRCSTFSRARCPGFNTRPQPAAADLRPARPRAAGGLGARRPERPRRDADARRTLVLAASAGDLRGARSLWMVGAGTLTTDGLAHGRSTSPGASRPAAGRPLRHPDDGLAGRHRPA